MAHLKLTINIYSIKYVPYNTSMSAPGLNQQCGNMRLVTKIYPELYWSKIKKMPYATNTVSHQNELYCTVSGHETMIKKKSHHKQYCYFIMLKFYLPV